MLDLYSAGFIIQSIHQPYGVGWNNQSKGITVTRLWCIQSTLCPDIRLPWMNGWLHIYPECGKKTTLIIALLPPWQGGFMFSTILVFLFVCLSVGNIMSQKVMNWLPRNFMEGSAVLIWQEQVIKFLGWSGSPSEIWPLFKKRCEWIAMKFCGGVWGGNRNKWLNFDGAPDHHADCSMENPATAQQIMSGFWWKFEDTLQRY